MMKYLIGLFVSFLLAGNLFAENLCDSSCNLTISFPEGGAIEAVEPLTIKFGDGGFINDGLITVAYPAGKTRSLTTGESIDFQSGGSFDLGYGGNIDYSDIIVQSSGAMDLSAVGGSSKVLIQDMTLLGGCSLNISSDIEVVETGLFHIFDGLVTASSDLLFTNHGSVSGLFDFENATLTLEEKDFDVTGGVLVEVDGQVTMNSRAVVISPVELDGSGPASDTVVPVDEARDVSASAADPSTTTVAEGGAGGGSGAVNFVSVLILSLLLLVSRYQIFGSRRHI
jgi:hypothetical protein